MMAQKTLAPNNFDKKPEPPKPAGKDNDAWDIPAFLRRRKR